MVIQSLTISKKRKEMKKIFYILAAAIVALGTVACENEGLDNINPNINVDGDTVSFVAGINRTALEGVATVWDTDDTIVVTWNDNNYEFKNAETGDKNTFKCTADGLSAIVDAKNIKAVYSNNKDGKVDSAAGVAGARLEYEGAFGNIAFEVKNAFLKFTTSETVTLTASEGLFGEGTELVISEAGEHYVAINPVAATLEYKVGESMGKNLETTFEAKKIYNLGNLTKSIAGDSNGKYYTELATAFKLAENGATISLLDDIVLESGVTVAAGKEYTLDLAGKTLSLVSNVMGGYLIQNNGVLTISNGTVDYTYNGEPDNTYGKGNYTISNCGTLTIESDAKVLNKTAAMSHANYAIDNISANADATLTIKGTVESENCIAVRQYAARPNSLEVVEGAEIEGTRGIQIFLPSSTASDAPEVSLNITGGTITSCGENSSNGYTYHNAIVSVSMGNSFENVSINIEGESTVINGDISLTTFYNNEQNGIENVTIKGGTFNMTNYIFSYGLWYDDDTLVNERVQITGGTYNKEEYEGYYGYHIADGYKAKANGDGTYTVAKVTYVARVGEEKYETFEAALAAAEAGSTIELLANVEGEYTIEKACTIVTNGKTITVEAGTDFNMASADGKYTFTAKVYVAQVGTTRYETWAEAYAAGNEITLLADIDGTVTLDKACTINTNGKNFDYTVATGFRETKNVNIITVVTLEASVWTIIGDHNSWTEGDTETVMYKTSTANVFVAYNVTFDESTASQGDNASYNEFKIRKDKAWTTQYGAGACVKAGYKANHSLSRNTGVEENGTYDIYFNSSTKQIAVMPVGQTWSDATDPKFDDGTSSGTCAWGITGSMNGWGTNDVTMYFDGTYWYAKGVQFEKNDEFKLRENAAWGWNYGANNKQNATNIGTNSDNIKAIAKCCYDVYVSKTQHKVWFKAAGQRP